MTRLVRTMSLSVCLVLLLNGCAKDPFSTRRPDKPLGNGGTYLTPVDPPIAVDTNLYHAMIERNAGHYLQTMADSVVYVFDYVLEGPPDSAHSWGIGEESRIAGNMFSGVSSIDAFWEPVTGRVDRFEDTTAILYRTYRISVMMAKSDSALSLSYRGEMAVTLRRNALDLWLIVRWEDLHTSAGSPSWADLKSRFR